MTLFKTSDFSIITCSCFCYAWKKIRTTGDESWKFDEIENGKKTLRKMFHQKSTIFHGCYSCLEKSILSNNFSLSTDDPNGHCIFFIKHGELIMENVCNGCLWFFIDKFRSDFFTY